MNGFTCPFCNKVMAINEATMQNRYPSFGYDNEKLHGPSFTNQDSLTITFFRCPSCKKSTIHITGRGPQVKEVSSYFHPNSNAKQFPDYIPKSIKTDYEEACAILDLSPKASATLSRRCLQGMIRDFWGISDSSLYKEITALKEKIDPHLWIAIDNLRQLGNIGAHMEKDTNVMIDIDPDEAGNLIKLIELLMREWYINREERNQLFADILSTNTEKQEHRRQKE